MTTQRDRLAAILSELEGSWTPDSMLPWPKRNLERADALLARGVRVVGVETLAAALANAFEFGPKLSRDAATDLLAVLDEQP